MSGVSVAEPAVGALLVDEPAALQGEAQHLRHAAEQGALLLHEGQRLRAGEDHGEFG